MGYKLLGVAVWRAARWYVKRRFPGAGRKALVGAAVVAGVAAAGAAAAAASRQGSDS
ncbi:MAG TPA: hypothetical protein VKT31_13245 [Solirubrobacteraceae bacterium]|nr:hypothetical protein [Solirubrobacteraceae bacterium]